MLNYIISFLVQVFLQIPLELQKAGESSPLAGALVGFIIILLGAIIFLFREYKIKQNELNISQDKNTNIQDKYIEKLDVIRKEMNDSEKETLKVLNGVSSILEMSEKMGANETQKIIDTIKSGEKSIVDTMDILRKTIDIQKNSGE